MSDKKQLILPPGSARLQATIPPATPSLPNLPTGNATVGPEWWVYQRNTRAVTASTGYMRSRADQAQACMELIQKRDELAMAIARLASIPERCAHAYERERLGRLNELRLLNLQHEHDELQAKIRVAAAQMQLAQFMPVPEPPAQPSPPAPTGLTPSDVQKVAQIMPEMKPETIEALVLALGGFLAEKNK